MDVKTQERLNDAIIAVQRFANSRKLDKIHAATSGVPLSTVAMGVLKEVVKVEPLSVSELGRAALMQPAALSRQINALRESGCIDVSRDTDDGRVSIVRSTAEGRKALERFQHSNGRLLSAQLGTWQDEEIDHLAAQMLRLVADLRAPIPDRPDR